MEHYKFLANYFVEDQAPKVMEQVLRHMPLAYYIVGALYYKVCKVGLPTYLFIDVRIDIRECPFFNI